jgi:hypothetical protein
VSDAKKKVMDMIKRRTQSNKRYKTKAAQRLGPEGIVLQFIEAYEKMAAEAKGPLDFETGLQREANMLFDRMRAIDPQVNVEIMWNNEDSTENWKDLQVDGVKITWSSFYLGKHPFSSPEKYIDVGSLMIEGHFDQD